MTSNFDAATVAALRGMDDTDLREWVPAYRRDAADADARNRTAADWHHTAPAAGGQADLLRGWPDRISPYPEEFSMSLTEADAQADVAGKPRPDAPGWRILGGSVQNVGTRWTRDDGALYVSDRIVLGEVTADTVSFETYRPDPEFDGFALDAEQVYDAECVIGAAHTLLGSRHSFVAEFWSLNIIGGSPVGWWHWTIPACSNVRFTGTTLNGRDPAGFAYRARVDQPLRYEVVESLPSDVRNPQP